MRGGRLVGEFSRAEATQHNVGEAMMSDRIGSGAGIPGEPSSGSHA
jgi:hypothetical protein